MIFAEKLPLRARFAVVIALNVVGIHGGDLHQLVLVLNALYHQIQSDAVYHFYDMDQQLVFICVVKGLNGKAPVYFDDIGP